MHTNKALILFLALCVASTVFIVDAKVAASSGTNLGVIPGNYHLTFGSGPQIIHVDTAVTRTGKPSIRLDRHTASDVNYCRECDGTWYNVKPGDHIVFKVWVKTSASGLYPDSSLTPGGRIGIDFYGHTSAGYGILYTAYDAKKSVTEPSWYGKPYGPNDKVINNWWVRYGSGWTQIGWDVYVPSVLCPYVYRNGIRSCTPCHVDSFVVWLDGRSTSNPGKVWFCDGEIYINP